MKGAFPPSERMVLWVEYMYGMHTKLSMNVPSYEEELQTLEVGDGGEGSPAVSGRLGKGRSGSRAACCVMNSRRDSRHFFLDRAASFIRLRVLWGSCEVEKGACHREDEATITIAAAKYSINLSDHLYSLSYI